MENNFKYAFTARIPLRLEDLDLNGHVTYAKYFAFFSQAWAEWMLDISETFDFDMMDCVVAKADCSYIKELRYPATLDVRIYIGEIHESSFVAKYKIFIEDDMHAEGTNKIVWLDKTTMKSTPLPDQFIEYFRSL